MTEEKGGTEDRLLQRLEKLILSGNTTNAKFVAQQLEDIYNKSISDLDKASSDPIAREKKALLVKRLGDVRRLTLMYDDALSIYNKSLSISPVSKVAVMAHLNIAEVYKDQGLWERSRQAQMAGRDISRRIGYKEGEADCLRGVGYSFWRTGDLEKALEVYKESIALVGEDAGTPLTSKILMETGNVLLEMHDYAKAKEMYDRASGPIERSGDRQLQVRFYNNIGYLITKLGDWPSAKRIFEKMLRTAELMEDRKWQGWAYSKLSECSTMMGEPKAGLNYAEESRLALEETKDNVGLIYTYVVFGLAHSALGNLKKTTESYEKALRIAGTGGTNSLVANFTLEYAKAISKMDRRLALFQARKALELLIRMNASKGVEECKVLIKELGG